MPPHASPAPSIEKVAPEQPPPEAGAIANIPGLTGIKNPAFPAAARSVAKPKGRSFTASDLDPYFPSGKPLEAKLEFDKGHFGKARLLLASEGDSLPVRYLRALSALRGEDYPTAAEEMATLAKDYPVLRDRCQLHAAAAQEQMHHFDAAAGLYAKVEPSSRLYSDARLGLVRVLHRTGDLRRAVDVASDLAAKVGRSNGRRDIGAEALIAAADLSREMKNTSAERGALIQLWSTHPLSLFSAQAERRLKRTHLPLVASVIRAEHLIDSHRNQQGMAVLEPLLGKLLPPDPLGCRAHFAYGKALRKERKHPKAAATLTPLVTKCRDSDLRARALFVLGSSQAVLDPKHAIQTYEGLARQFPDHPFADDALFYSAELHLKAGEPELALRRLQELSEKYPSGDFFAEALFRSFWIYRQQKRSDRQLQLLTQLETTFANSDAYEVERGEYWRGRTLESLDQKGQAVELLSSLAEKHPASYYGLMARLRLERLDPEAYQRLAPRLAAPTEVVDPWPLYPGAMAEDLHFRSGVELLRLGFPDFAAQELLGVNRAGQSPESLRLLVTLLAFAGDSRSAHGVARLSLRSELSGRMTRDNRTLWEMAYPNAFRAFTEKFCGTEGLDPDLLQSLMREESALDPRALSPAGALGLTQLMLPTAQALAKQLKMPKVTHESLLQPEPNIRLGAHYLASLLKQFNGNTAHALAGYNAGPLAVKRWKAALPKHELDEWIEEIPISETRGYVKRVLRTYNTYRLLYARQVSSGAVLLSGLPSR